MQTREEAEKNYINELEAYAACGDIAAAERVFIQMTMNGAAPDNMAYCSLMGAYAKCEDVKGCWNLVDQMIAKGLELNSTVATIVLKTLNNKGKEVDYTRLLEIMDQVKCEIIVYNVFVDYALKNHLENNAWKAFNKLADEKRADEITYNTMLKHCAINKNVKDALTIYGMVNERFELSIVTINTLMDMYVRTENYQEAWQLFDSMKGVEADGFTYSILMKALVYDKYGFEKAMRLMDEIKEKNMCMDEILYNSVMDICVRFGQSEKAIAYYNEMLLSDIPPSSVTYGILIKAYGKMNQVSNAVKVFRKMKDASVVTYGCLIDACVKNEEYSIAWDLYNGMKKNGIAPNTIIYTIMIKGFARSRELNNALSILDEMSKSSDTAPNNITYNSLLDCCVKCRRLDKALEIFKQMKERNTPDLISYSILIKGYCYNKKIAEALKMLEEMTSKNICADEILYNSLMEGCFKSNEPVLALKIYGSMKLQNLQPTGVTNRIIAKIYGQVKDANKAIQLLAVMKSDKITPPLTAFTCLIKVCMKSKEPIKALQLYAHLKSESIHADSITFTTLLEGLLAHKLYYEAADVLADCLNSGIEMTKDIIKTVCEQKLCIDPIRHSILVQYIIGGKGPNEVNKTLTDISNLNAKESHKKRADICGKENKTPLQKDGKIEPAVKIRKLDRVMY
jgi:pentatricopeptide repeat protein